MKIHASLPRRAACYIPLTVALIRRIRILFRRSSEAPGSVVPDVFRKVEDEYARLADFFRFQEADGLDWCSGQLRDYCPGDVHPLRPGSIEGNPLAGLAVFALWVGYR